MACNMHVHTNKHTFLYVHAHTCLHMHACIHTHTMHTFTHVYTQSHTCAHTHACSHMCTHSHTCVQPLTHAHLHTLTHAPFLPVFLTFDFTVLLWAHLCFRSSKPSLYFGMTVTPLVCWWPHPGAFSAEGHFMSLPWEDSGCTMFRVLPLTHSVTFVHSVRILWAFASVSFSP